MQSFAGEILTNNQLENIKHRYPKFELSYESMLHNKVPPKYDMAFAIPLGKKSIAWYTFYENRDVLIIMDLNKEKRIVSSMIVPCNFNFELSYGTVFYGTALPEFNVFVIEDIHYSKGIHVSTLCLQDKFPYILNILKNDIHHQPGNVSFTLPVFWKHHDGDSSIPIHIQPDIPYAVHHIQYRSIYEIKPFLNHTNKSEKEHKTATPDIYIPISSDFRKPQFKLPTVFIVKADIQFDIYRLYVYGKNNSLVYYNTAYIPDYKTSVFMNRLFRNIKENENLDYIEESDDEDDFQNTNPEKYVNLHKSIQMECTFHTKFKRWIPHKTVYKQRVVHLSQLQFLKQHNYHKYHVSHTYN